MEAVRHKLPIPLVFVSSWMNSCSERFGTTKGRKGWSPGNLMIDVFFVLDGPRDHVSVPPLVGRILGVGIRAQTTHWARLRQKGNARGFSRQLLFAIRQAQDAKATALVAVVDRDN